MMKPILHSVSYAGLWGQSTLSLEEFVPRAARLGYSGVMLMTKRPHLSPLDYDRGRLEQLSELLSSNQLEVACLAGYNDPGAGSGASFAPVSEMQLIAIRQWAEAARRLRAPILRLFTGPVHESEPFTVQWRRSVEFLRQACDIAVEQGVIVGVQNHDDIAAHSLSLADLIDEVDRPNCKACFDAWAVALQGDDLSSAVRHLGSRIVHTTVADYVKRPRFKYYHPGLGNNYERSLDEVKAVPPGEGFIDYPSFFKTLREIDYRGGVAFEMCSPLRGGGDIDNLDRYARRFIEMLHSWIEPAI